MLVDLSCNMNPKWNKSDIWYQKKTAGFSNMVAILSLLGSVGMMSIAVASGISPLVRHASTSPQYVKFVTVLDYS